MKKNREKDWNQFLQIFFDHLEGDKLEGDIFVWQPEKIYKHEVFPETHQEQT